MKLILYILLVLTISPLGFANELKVVANSFHGNNIKGISVFDGDVKITKGSDELNASNVIIYLNKLHKPTKMIANGHVSFYITAENNASYHGKAHKVIYLPAQKEYQFYKNVHIWQINNKREIEGNKIILNISTGQAVANGAKHSPVVMIFNLKNKNQKQSK